MTSLTPDPASMPPTDAASRPPAIDYAPPGKRMLAVDPEHASTTEAEKRYYPVFLDLAGRSCLVVGGGTIALEKARALLDCSAQVTVVAPHAVPDLLQLPVEWLQRRFNRSDLAGRFLVVAATSTPAVNRHVHAEAEAHGLPCNVVDVPKLCSFIMPAVLRRDPITIAVSTGGASPALAQRLRDRIAEIVTAEDAALARHLRQLRPWAKTQFPTYAERRDFFADLVNQEQAKR